MNTSSTISATEARNRWFEILNRVAFGGETILIAKNNKPLVKLVVADSAEKEPIEDFIKRTAGFLKGKKTYWPSLDPRVRKREIRAADRVKAWK